MRRPLLGLRKTMENPYGEDRADRFGQKLSLHIQIDAPPVPEIAEIYPL
jgi:hypothetical protein